MKSGCQCVKTQPFSGYILEVFYSYTPVFLTIYSRLWKFRKLLGFLLLVINCPIFRFSIIRDSGLIDTFILHLLMKTDRLYLYPAHRWGIRPNAPCWEEEGRFCPHPWLTREPVVIAGRASRSERSSQRGLYKRIKKTLKCPAPGRRYFKGQYCHFSSHQLPRLDE